MTSQQKRHLLTSHLIYGHLTRNLCFFSAPAFLLFYRLHLAQLIQYRQMNLPITANCFSSFEILTIGHFATLSHLNNNKTDSISPQEGNWLTSLLGKLLVSSLVCSLLAMRFAHGNIFYQIPPKNRIWWFSCQLTWLISRKDSAAFRRSTSVPTITNEHLELW